MSHNSYQKYNIINWASVSTLGIFIMLNALMYCYLNNMLIAEQNNIVNYYFSLITNLLTEFQINDLSYPSVKLQEFKMLLDKLLPEYTEYKIFLHDKVIALSKTYNSQYLYSKSIMLDNGDYVRIQLNCSNKFFGNLGRNILLISLTISIIAYTFICLVLLNNHYYKKQLKLKILIQEQRINELLVNRQIEQEIRSKFIDKAVSIYANKRGKDNNTLFPLCLIEPLQAEVLVEDMIKLLRAYVLDYNNYTQLKINCSVPKISINCAKEVFYQIIFSIVKNLVLLHRNNKNDWINIKMLINDHSIKFLVKGYKINEDLLKNNNTCSDVFLLSYDKIVESLKKHLLDFSMTYENNNNVFEIFFHKNYSIKVN